MAEPLEKKVRLDSADKENVDSSVVVRKRKDYLQWDEYFMAVAFLSAQRSKDPKTQVNSYSSIIVCKLHELDIVLYKSVVSELILNWPIKNEKP